MSGWYVLVRDWTERERAPRAIGPYPSKEFCRLAAEAMIPDDRQFWTDEKREHVERVEQEEERRRRAELAVKISELGGEGGRVTIGSHQYLIDDRGEIIGSSSGGYSTYGPSYSALTGCVFIDTEHQ